MLSRAVLLATVVAATAAAHPEFTMPLAQIKATPLPAGVLGSGSWSFNVEPQWARLPAGVSLGPTHGGVAVDRSGRIYVSSDGPDGILVFAPDGTFERGMAREFSGIHGIVIRDEAGREFIYAAHLKGNQVVKLSLEGDVQWTLGVPTESGHYEIPADAGGKPTPYRPTAVAVGPDGRIYVADGYGASVIHVFDRDRNYLKTIGTRGEGEGQFRTCHGLVLDARFEAPLLLVADRENRRLVHLDLEGNFVRVVARDLRRPCAISFQGDHAAVAELEGRVIVIDKAGDIVATLGDNPDQEQWAKFKIEPQHWKDGIFIAPHGLAFDGRGNLFVQDWNFAGRLTKLRRTGPNQR